MPLTEPRVSWVLPWIPGAPGRPLGDPDTRDRVIRLERQAEDLENAVRDLERKFDDHIKEARAIVQRYDDVLSRMKGIWWFMGALSVMGGALSTLLYHWVWPPSPR